MAAVAAKAGDLSRLNTTLLAISIDTVFSHIVWNETELSKLIPGGFPYPMVSDLSGKIGQLYGVYDENLNLNLRGTFIIDPDGVIQVAQVYNAPIGRNFDELVRAIEAAQHVRNAEGKEACPADWKPGAATLKPSKDLIGKVYQYWGRQG